MKSLKASAFKATCLAVLDEVEQTGEPVTILKRGRPVAQVVAVVARGERYPQETLRGMAEEVGDIVAPVVPPEAWEVIGGRGR